MRPLPTTYLDRFNGVLYLEQPPLGRKGVHTRIVVATRQEHALPGLHRPALPRVRRGEGVHRPRKGGLGRTHIIRRGFFEMGSGVGHKMTKNYRNTSKTSKVPRRPFEKERLVSELEIIGKYGLRNKREIWRVQLTLSKVRKAARELLTMEENDPKRIFEGDALLRRLTRLGILGEDEQKLDFVLGLTVEKFLDRRLQTMVAESGLAKSIHHARVLIRQRHIRVGRKVVNVPSFMVRVNSEKHIDYSLSSPFGQGRPGRVSRKKEAAAGGGDSADDE